MQWAGMESISSVRGMAATARQIMASPGHLPWEWLSLGRQIARLRQDDALRQCVQSKARQGIIEDSAQEIMAKVVLDQLTLSDVLPSGYVRHYGAIQLAWVAYEQHDDELLTNAVVRLHEIPDDAPTAEHLSAATASTYLFDLLLGERTNRGLNMSRREFLLDQMDQETVQMFGLHWLNIRDGFALRGRA